MTSTACGSSPVADLPPADDHRWRSATTVAELAALTALWLEGSLASQTGYDGGPDDETRDLIPVLAALNRAGYRTCSSQPGVPRTRGFDGAYWKQRAAVYGFLHAPLADRIAAAARSAGLLVARYDGVAREITYDGISVTKRGRKPYTWFGRHLTLGWVRDIHPDCSEEAIQALATAVQLTVVDPEWGRNDVLWPLLMDLTA